jgi:hypothetical protein
MAVLEITFTGLFLFVPDTKSPKALHVLLPATGTMGVPKHEATIGHLGPDTAIPLGREDIAVPAAQGTLLFPPNEAVDLEEITSGQRFPRNNLKKRDPGPRIHARVKLPLATSIEPGQTAEWGIEGFGMRTLTHRIIWTLDELPDTSVTLKRKPFGGTETDLVFNADADGLVRLCIQHLPVGENTPKAGERVHVEEAHTHDATRGMEAKHFAAYYKSDPVFGTGPNPKLAETPGEPQKSECDRFAPARNAETFTCMVAQVRAAD